MQVKELSTNIRSGHDVWWRGLLKECRHGALSETNFCWLQGLPTDPTRKAAFAFWYAQRGASESSCTCPDAQSPDSCKACVDERDRRCRWHAQRETLNLERRQAWRKQCYSRHITMLSSNTWKACTVNLPRKIQVQVIWLQWVDSVPKSFAGLYGSEVELHKEQEKWRHFNAKKRKGILGVVGLYIGMR